MCQEWQSWRAVRAHLGSQFLARTTAGAKLGVSEAESAVHDLLARNAILLGKVVDGVSLVFLGQPERYAITKERRLKNARYRFRECAEGTRFLKRYSLWCAWSSP